MLHFYLLNYLSFFPPDIFYFNTMVRDVKLRLEKNILKEAEEITPLIVMSYLSKCSI